MTLADKIVQGIKEMSVTPRTKCEKCHERIKADTDDNYNSEHTKIQCPECRHWQDA